MRFDTAALDEPGTPGSPGVGVGYSALGRYPAPQSLGLSSQLDEQEAIEACLEEEQYDDDPTGPWVQGPPAGSRRSRQSRKHEKQAMATRCAASCRLLSAPGLPTCAARRRHQRSPTIVRPPPVSLCRLLSVGQRPGRDFFEHLAAKLDEYGVATPTVQIEYRGLTVRTEAVVGAAGIPTAGNFALRLAKVGGVLSAERD